MNLFLKLPKGQMVLFLFFIALSALIEHPKLLNFYIIFASVLFTIFFDLLFTYFRSKKLFVPYAAIVTGIITGLIVNSSLSLYQIPLVCALSMGIKNFARVGNRHIFNPAGSGLVFGSIILGTHISWWAVSFQNIFSLQAKYIFSFLLLLAPVFVSGLKMKRYYAILSFLTLYTIFSQIVSLKSFSGESFLNTFFDPTVLFFSIVMLPEPMTSPVNSKRQILYAGFVALISQLISLPILGNSIIQTIPDPLVSALLLGNLVFFKYR
ncbi:MAG: hypothetical protein A2857_06890 [Candidatus Levybacteria bacterium RIFCSPHIGHO2_01_FULL_36_15]|nr:MAG: hypothetical protein A2857_06890 [Candidatus Levybacteria bacterium RIFCSPHIGHO2_01_FULL_36_15]